MIAADVITPQPPSKAGPASGQDAQGQVVRAAASRAEAGSVAGFDLEAAAGEAARALFAGRDVAVRTFFDRDAGRTVVEVKERTSGETLAQFPPDELLRFYASAAPDLRQPLVSFAT